MNSCRRIARTGDWSSGVNTLLTRFRSRTNCRRDPGPASSLSRGQATAAGEKPRLTAADLARKLQQERRTPPPAAEAPVSAQQKRVEELKRFSLQLQNVHPNVLAKHLLRSVLYQDEDVVVISKPHGVPFRGKQTSSLPQFILLIYTDLLTRLDQVVCGDQVREYISSAKR